MFRLPPGGHARSYLNATARTASGSSTRLAVTEYAVEGSRFTPWGRSSKGVSGSSSRAGRGREPSGFDTRHRIFGSDQETPVAGGTIMASRTRSPERPNLWHHPTPSRPAPGGPRVSSGRLSRLITGSSCPINSRRYYMACCATGGHLRGAVSPKGIRIRTIRSLLE